MPILRKLFSKRTLVYLAGGTAVATGGGYYYLNSGPAYPQSTKEKRRPPPPWTPPSRSEMLARLKASGPLPTSIGASTKHQGKKDKKVATADDDEYEFDLLVIGGGATGAGVAVDAASRGLKVALVERDDFSSGTSSKSTKLVHGGVRYLQKAVFELDYGQYKLVREALHERRIFLQTAPYLSSMLPIMLPVYKYWQVPYYWAGCKMYDILAGKENMESSYIMSKGKALETFPMLKSEGLVGAVVYYDGQHNDSRMNIALILSAVKHGAAVANYCEVTSLTKDPVTQKITGATVRDTLTGAAFPVRAKGVINATGPFTDSLLSLDNPAHKPIVQASSGIHITLPGYYSPRTMGLLDPSTSDGRVIFFLPWQGNTIAGTTDTPSKTVDREVTAEEDDIKWVLDEVRNYLAKDIRVRRGDVLSAWSGLRPLVKNPNADTEGTAGLVRSHVLHVSDSGLLTIAGGKWTTYRKMAEETVDKAVEVFGLERRVKSGCVTDTLRLVGSDGWSRNMFIGLIQTYGLETEVARHLSDNYGDRAWTVCSLAEPTGESWPLHGKRLSPLYPFIEAEIRYALKHEYAQTPIDILARRTRLSFLNSRAALDALPRVVEIMSAEFGWTRKEQRKQMKDAVQFLVGSMGLLVTDKKSVEEVVGELERDVHVKAKAKARGWGVWEGVNGLGLWIGFGATMANASAGDVKYSRARFEAGELGLLRHAFESRADREKGRGKESISKTELMDVVKDIPGYGEISGKDYLYVLEEAALKDKEEIDFDEFIEICGNLKDVAFAPVPSRRRKRLSIPVEKSGGGV